MGRPSIYRQLPAWATQSYARNMAAARMNEAAQSPLAESEPFPWWASPSTASTGSTGGMAPTTATAPTSPRISPLPLWVRAMANTPARQSAMLPSWVSRIPAAPADGAPASQIGDQADPTMTSIGMPAWTATGTPAPAAAQSPATTVVAGGPRPVVQQVSPAPEAEGAGWQTPAWFPAVGTFGGQVARDVWRNLGAIPTAIGQLGEGDLAGAAQTAAKGLAVSDIPALWARVGQQQNLGDTLGALLAAGTGTLAAGLPLAPKALFPLLNAPTQAIEGGLGAVMGVVPKAAGPLGRTLWRYASLPGIINTINDFQGALEETKEDAAAIREGKPVFELAPSINVQAYMDADAFRRYLGQDYTEKYRNRKRTTLGRIDLEASPYGGDPAASWAMWLSQNVAFSGPEARDQVVKRMLAGEDPDVALRGLYLPENPSQDEIDNYWTKSQEYLDAAGRIARVDVLRAGGSAKVAYDAEASAKREAAELIASTGFIPGAEMPTAELIGQTLIGFSPLDPANKVMPLVNKVFGWGPLKKLPVAGKVISGVERAGLAVARQLPEQRARGEADRFTQVFSEEMRAALDAEIEGVAPKAAQAAAASKVPVLRQLGQAVTWLAEHTPTSRARVYEGHALDVTSNLLRDAVTPAEAMDILRRFADQPATLVDRFGNVPISVKAEVARPVVKAMLESDTLKNLPSLKAADFNPVRFQYEVGERLRNAARAVADVPDQPSTIERIANGMKGNLAEFYLRTLGYVVRNAANNYGTLLADGLLARDSFDAWRTYMRRAGLSEDAALEVKPAGFLGEVGVPEALVSREAGMYDTSRQGQTVSSRLIQKVPGLRAVHNKIGEISNAVETNARIGAFTTALRQFIDKNWYPRLSDGVRQYFGRDFQATLDAVESGFRQGMNEKELRAVVDRVMNATHPAATFYAEQYLRRAGLPMESLSPEMLARISDEMQKQAQNGAAPGDADVFFAAEEKAIREEYQRRLANMPMATSPRASSEADIRQDVTEQAAFSKMLADQLIKAGVFNDQTAGAAFDDLVQELARNEETIRRAQARMAQAFGDLPPEASADGFAQVVRWAQDQEYRVRGEARLQTQAELAKAWTAIAKIKADVKAAKGLARGATAGAATLGGMRQVWDRYRQEAGQIWRRANGDIVKSYDQAKGMLDRLKADPANFAEIAQSVPDFETAGTYADRMIEEARKSMDRRDPETVQEFERIVAIARQRIDIARRGAWYNAIAIVRAEPELARDVFDVMVRADQDMIRNGNIAVGRKFKALAAKDAGEIDFKQYNEATAAIWREFFAVTEAQYREQVTAQLTWVQADKSPIVQALRASGLADDKIMALMARIGEPAAQAEINRILAGGARGEPPQGEPPAEPAGTAAPKPPEPPKPPGAAPAGAPAGTSASIPVMFTQKMMRDLRALGYTDADMGPMTPADAWKIIQDGTRAPSAAPAAAPVEEGYREALSGFAGGISDSLYRQMFEALQRGEVDMAGVRDPALVAAKPAFDRGEIKSADDLRQWIAANYKPAGSAAAPAVPKAPATVEEFMAGRPDLTTPEAAYREAARIADQAMAARPSERGGDVDQWQRIAQRLRNQVAAAGAAAAPAAEAAPEIDYPFPYRPYLADTGEVAAARFEAENAGKSMDELIALAESNRDEAARLLSLQDVADEAADSGMARGGAEGVFPSRSTVRRWIDWDTGRAKKIGGKNWLEDYTAEEFITENFPALATKADQTGGVSQAFYDFLLAAREHYRRMDSRAGDAQYADAAGVAAEGWHNVAEELSQRKRFEERARELVRDEWAADQASAREMAETWDGPERAAMMDEVMKLSAPAPTVEAPTVEATKAEAPAEPARENDYLRQRLSALGWGEKEINALMIDPTAARLVIESDERRLGKPGGERAGAPVEPARQPERTPEETRWAEREKPPEVASLPPRERMTRDRFGKLLADAYGYDADQTNAVLALADANAGVWARATGRDPADYWDTYIADVVKGGIGEQFQSPADGFGPMWYSVLRRTIEQKMPARASVAQVRGLVKSAGIKADELKWTGFEDWLASRGDGPVTKVEALDAIKEPRLREKVLGEEEVDGANDGLAQYDEYMLPGAHEPGSYRELLMYFDDPRRSTPEVRRLKQAYDDAVNAERDATNAEGLDGLLDVPDRRGRPRIGTAAWLTMRLDQAEATRKAREAYTAAIGKPYKSPHFGAAGNEELLAHLRVAERMDADGRPVMVIEEIQSDWHQAGRKKGYNDSDALKALMSERAALVADDTKPLDINRYNLLTEQIVDLSAGVPAAPWAKTWHEMVFRRALRLAAEEGYERMAWTTGAQQAERYGIASIADSLWWKKQIIPDDGIHGERVLYTVRASQGGNIVFDDSAIRAEELSQAVGESIAARIKSKDTGTLTGDELLLGDEGMSGFYDKMLGDYARKYGKRWGAEVSDITLGLTAGGATVHSIEITEPMRASVLAEGQPLFQSPAARQEGAGIPERPRGAISWDADRKATLHALEAPDASTAMHELWHLFERTLYDSRDNAIDATRKAQIDDDIRLLEAWSGGDPEKIARGGEQYVREGKAPVEGLAHVFQMFKEWLARIYARLVGSPLVELSDDVRAVFGRMLADQEQIDAYRATMEPPPAEPAGPAPRPVEAEARAEAEAAPPSEVPPREAIAPAEAMPAEPPTVSPPAQPGEQFADIADIAGRAPEPPDDVIQGSLLPGIAPKQRPIEGEQAGLFGPEATTAKAPERAEQDLRTQYNALARQAAIETDAGRRAAVEQRMAEIERQAAARGISLETSAEAGPLFGEQPAEAAPAAKPADIWRMTFEEYLPQHLAQDVPYQNALKQGDKRNTAVERGRAETRARDSQLMAVIDAIRRGEGDQIPVDVLVFHGVKAELRKRGLTPEGGPMQPAAEPAAPPVAEPAIPAMPALKVGDRVEWTDARGKRLTGTVKSFRSEGAEAHIQTDQSTEVLGVPILRVDDVPLHRLSPEGQPATKYGEEAPKAAPKAEAAEAEAGPAFKKGDRVVLEDGRHGEVTEVVEFKMQSVFGGDVSHYTHYRVKTDPGVEKFVTKADTMQAETERPATVVPDPLDASGTPIEPALLDSSIGWHRKQAQKARDSAARRRKADLKANDLKAAKMSDEMAAKLQSTLDAWIAKYPDEAKRLGLVKEPKPAPEQPAARPGTGRPETAPAGEAQQRGEPTGATYKGARLTFIADKDTRDGTPLWLVKAEDRLSTNDYRDLLAQVKRAGGEWSRFKGAFLWRDETKAREFYARLAPKPAAAPAPAPAPEQPAGTPATNEAPTYAAGDWVTLVEGGERVQVLRLNPPMEVEDIRGDWLGGKAAVISETRKIKPSYTVLHADGYKEIVQAEDIAGRAAQPPAQPARAPEVAPEAAAPRAEAPAVEEPAAPDATGPYIPKVGDRVAYLDQAWQVTGVTGNSIDLRSDTGEPGRAPAQVLRKVPAGWTPADDEFAKLAKLAEPFLARGDDYNTFYEQGLKKARLEDLPWWDAGGRGTLPMDLRALKAALMSRKFETLRHWYNQQALDRPAVPAAPDAWTTLKHGDEGEWAGDRFYVVDVTDDSVLVTERQPDGSSAGLRRIPRAAIVKGQADGSIRVLPPTPAGPTIPSEAPNATQPTRPGSGDVQLAGVAGPADGAEAPAAGRPGGRGRQPDAAQDGGVGAPPAESKLGAGHAGSPQGVPPEGVPGAGEVRPPVPGDVGAGTGSGAPVAGTGGRRPYRPRSEGAAATPDVPDQRSGGRVPAEGGSGGERGGSGVRSPRPGPAGDAGRGAEGRDSGDVSGGVTQPGRKGRDYTITDADDIGGGTFSQKYRDNLAAIKLLKQIEAEGRLATPEEQAQLVKYTGWGAFGGVFDDRKSYTREYQQVKEALTTEEWTAAWKSTLNAHYTSIPIIRAMYQALKRFGFQGGRFLEPASGIGHFVGAMPPEMKANSRITMVEMDSITARIAAQLYQGADVRGVPYQETRYPKNWFDVAVSNVPFGKVNIHDPAYNKVPFMLGAVHNYYFAKSLDAVKPGGLIAFITSRFTMDSEDTRVRAYISERADFIGAVRLPDDTFRGNAGTDVVTDIIFLRKRVPGEAPTEWTERWQDVGDVQPPTIEDPYGPGMENANDPIKVNEYYLRHPEMMLGTMTREGKMYSKYEPTLTAAPDQDTPRLLEQAVARLPENVYVEGRVKAEEKPRDVVGVYTGRQAEGTLTFRNGKLVQIKGGAYVEPDLSKAAMQRATGMAKLRDLEDEVLRAQMEPGNDVAFEAARTKLLDAYNRFVKEWGPLHGLGNKQAFGSDPDLSRLLAIETWDVETKKAAPADILLRRVIDPTAKTLKADTAADAVAISLNESGRLDWKLMSELTGRTQEQMLDELKDSVFLDPDGDWTVGEVYLSGNVREKLLVAREAAKVDERYARNVAALERVIPADVPPARIVWHISNGVTPSDIMGQFVHETLGVMLDGLMYHEGNARWTWQGQRGRFSNLAVTQYGTADADPLSVFDAALNNKRIIIRRKQSDGSEVVDADATAAAGVAVRAIDAAFQKWALADVERSMKLGRLWNDKLNAIVNPKWDGRHLTLAGASKKWKDQLRTHQRNAVWRVISSGNTMLAHDVGTGKTAIIIASAVEGKRLGVFKKPAIIVLKSGLKQWEAAFNDMYPGKRLLAVTDTMTGNKKAREELASRIATNDWDAIILTHENLSKLPVSAQSFAAFIQQEIDRLKAVLYEIEPNFDAKKSKNRTAKHIAKQIENLETKMRDKLAAEAKDKAITFEETGIDQIFVDESHYFKNLMYASAREGNIKGMGNRSGSKRALDLYMKSQILAERTNGRGVVFATATPVSNSIVELYNVQRYLQESRLRALGVQNFDAWANQYGEITSQLEKTAAGSYKVTDRMAKFINLQSLQPLMGEVWDAVQLSDIPGLVLPDIQGGRPATVAAPETPELTAKMQNLQSRAEHLTGDLKTDNMLKISNEGRAASLDMRLIDAGAPDRPENKINAVVREVLAVHKEFEDRRLTQLVFVDMSAPREEMPEIKLTAKDGMWVLVEDTPAQKVIAEFTNRNDAAAAGQLYNIEQRKLSVPNEIKRKLVEAGVPANEIEFAQMAKTDIQREKMQARVRAGTTRILIGSTQTMGVGLNVQDRLIALHDVDAPYRPADIEQRLGRIVRQGNQNKEVRVFRYITEGSQDEWMWQLLEAKARPIKQLMRLDYRGDELIDEGDVIADYAMMKAKASGNMALMKYMQVQLELEEVSRLERAHEDRRRQAIYDAASLPKDIARYEDQIKQLQAAREEHLKAKEAPFSMKVNGTVYDKPQAAGKAVNELINGMPDKGEFSVETANVKYQLVVTVSQMGQIKAHWALAKWEDPLGRPTTIRILTSDGPLSNANRLREAYIRDVDTTIKFREEKLPSWRESLRQAEPVINAPFDQADRKAELLQLDQIYGRQAGIYAVGGQVDNGAAAKMDETPYIDAEMADIAKGGLRVYDQWKRPYLLVQTEGGDIEVKPQFKTFSMDESLLEKAGVAKDEEGALILDGEKYAEFRDSYKDERRLAREAAEMEAASRMPVKLEDQPSAHPGQPGSVQYQSAAPGSAIPGQDAARARDKQVAADGNQEGPNFEEMLDAATKQQLKALEVLRAGYRAHFDDFKPGAGMPKDARTKLEQELKRVIREHHDMLSAGTSYAKTRTNTALLDYGDKHNFDTLLSLFAPFSFWTTRSARNWALRLAQNPKLLTALLRYQEAMEKENRRRGTRKRFQNGIQIPGTDVYVDPMMLVFPYAGLIGYDLNDAEDARTLTQQLYGLADTFGMRVNPVFDIPLRLSGALMNKQAEDQGEQARTWGPESIAQLIPQTGLIQAATSALGIGGPTGFDIEAPVRRALGTYIPGMNEGESWDPYRAMRSVADMAALENRRADEAGQKFDPQPYLLASELAQKYAKADWTRLLNTMGPDEAAVALQVDPALAMRALEIIREGAKQATQQRGFSQVASGVFGVRALQEPAGEKERRAQKAEEKAVAYNPATGYGSREAVNLVRERYPALDVARSQYGGLPGETQEIAYIYEQAERANVNAAFDQLRDSLIQAQPWNRRGVYAIEDGRQEALGTVRGAGSGATAAGESGWQAIYQKTMTKAQGGSVQTDRATYPYRPASVSGATPAEALTIRQNEVLRYVSGTRPRREDFIRSDGQPDYPAYQAAVSAWAAQLPAIAAGLPETSPIMEQARKDKAITGKDIATPLDAFIRGLTETDVEDYWRRNDSPVEAAQRAYFDLVYDKAWAYYRQQVAAGVDKGDAYAQSVGAVPALGPDKLALAVEKLYPGRWTPEELTAALSGITMPPLTEVHTLNQTEAQRTKSQASEEFWNIYNQYIPPGRASSDLKESPTVLLVLDQDSRGTATTEQYQMAVAVMKNWLMENYPDLTPAQASEFQAARKANAQLTEIMAQRFGAANVRKLNEYYRLPNAQEKERFRIANPAVMQMLFAKRSFGLSNPVYAKYYGVGALK